MIDIPILIAGPILRRVEPKLVSVWVALKVEASVKIDVYEGSQFASKLPNTPLASGAFEALKIGENLYIAVAMAKPEQLLSQEKHYAYNITLKTKEGTTHDLKKLGLLENRTINGNLNLPLGYSPDRLPSFVLPADKIEKLKIIHGSCRNNDNKYEDALAYLDEILEESIKLGDAGAKSMPQQLFMSGDQIYADSVVGSLLDQLTESANLLLGDKEFLPTIWPDNKPANVWPANKKNFPAFIRDRLLDSEARFTTSDTQNHLISFGEFSTMYLFGWSNTLWDIAGMHNFEAIIGQYKNSKLPEPWGALFRPYKTAEREGDKEVIKDNLLEKTLSFLLASGGDFNLKDWAWKKAPKKDKVDAEESLDLFKLKNVKEEEADLFEELTAYLKEWFGRRFGDTDDYTEDKNKAAEFYKSLPRVRRALANLPSYMIFDDHDVTDDWNLNPMWMNRVYTSPLGRTIVRNALMAYAIFQDWGNRPLAYARKGYLFELDKKLSEDFATETLSDPIKKVFTAKGINLNAEKTTIKKTAEGEWLLIDQNSADEFLVRKVKEDGDREFLKVLGNPHAFLLEQIPKLFKSNSTPDTKTENIIDWLLGLDQAQEMDKDGGYKYPENRRPPVKWHYTYEGSQHKVLVIDNRTQRSFASLQGPPINLSSKGMDDLIPKNPDPKEDEVLIVVAPLPVIGPPLLDELIAPLAYRAFDIKSYLGNDENVRSGMAGTNPDAIEAWCFDPVSLEDLLKRLARFKRVVLLSGDVHYGSSQALTYWTKEGKEPAHFAQFTASGFRNVMPSYIQVVSQHIPLAQSLVRIEFKADRLGWHKKSPTPIKNEKTHFDPHLKELLKESPVLLSTFLLPEGTMLSDAAENPPDWAWRLRPIMDKRPEIDRPEVVRLVKLEEIKENEKNTLTGIRKVVARHAKQIQQFNYTRQILFASNFGMVTFKKEKAKEEEASNNPPKLIAVHSLYATYKDTRQDDKILKGLFAQHEVDLMKEEEKPTIGTKS